MRTPHHKGQQHRWDEPEIEKLKSRAAQNLNIQQLAKEFKTTVGAMMMFCKRRGIQVAGYHCRTRVSA